MTDPVTGINPVIEHEMRLELMISILNDILTELRHLNNAERTGAVSSIQIEDNPTKERPVRVTTKHYVGSPLTEETLNEQLDAHAYAHREAERRQMEGWAVTVQAALADKHKAIYGSEETGTAYDLPGGYRA